jgi:23S rRNA pseudouridine1911/1915/1917 synthase
MATIEVIYEDNHLLVINKPKHMPSQADESQDLDVATAMKQYLKDKYNKPNNVYLGLLHRLDRPVSGLMVLAKTSKAAARMSKQIQDQKIIKQYHCVVEGKPKQGVYVDYLKKDQKLNQTVVSKDGKKAELDVISVVTKGQLSLCHISLHTGRSHQIRVQMAHRNTPIYNDHRYNKNAKIGQDIALIATYLEFVHPTTKELMTFKLPLPINYPWDQFR